ncbi:M1 family aminopeptidase [Fibrella arboris]|uniref:M1 family aminopeptidase n=1 Tax=Fibrella arboris TaxID=3242486 RepID=UPI0035207FBF
MFSHLFTFEIRYWLRQPMVWIFMLVNTVMFAWAAASDDLSIGGSFGNIFKNAPYVIQNQYGVWTIFALLMTTAFVQNAALRDFTYNSHQLVFSSPIRKVDYLAGRFLGSYVVALIPFFGISIGILLGTLIGQATGTVEAERYGPVVWSAHVNAFLTFAMGNTFISGAFIFMLAALSRSTVVAFVGAVLLLVAQAVAGNLLGDLDNETLVAYFDALGFGPFELATKYWTVADKNTRSVGLLDGYMGINRAIWFGIGLLWLGITYLRFSFAERVSGGRWFSRRRKTDALPTDAAGVAVFGTAQPLPRVQRQTGTGAQVAQLFRVARTDFNGTIRGVAFIVILLAGLLNMGFSLRFADDFYGLYSYPVTYNVIQTIQGTMGIFLFAIIIFYSGDLIWKERDADLAQIYDSMPHRNWSVFVGKLLAMIGVVALIQVVCVGAGILAQTLMGYTVYDLRQYVVEFFLIGLSRLIPIIVLSMLMHTLVNNKYVAFFAVVVVLITNGYIWGPLDVQSNLVQFNATPDYTYSDMNGWGPYVASLVWFRMYWSLFTALLGVVAVLFWVRGKDTAWANRWQLASRQFNGLNRRVTIGLMVGWLIVGSFLAYNTFIVNPFVTSKVQEKRQVAYEKTYKKFEHRPQPRITDVTYSIDLYPEERAIQVRGRYVLTNKTGSAIDSLHVLLPNRLNYTMTIAGARRVLNDSILQYTIYKLARPMAPGDSLLLTWTAHREARGVENEVEFVQQVNQNGSFFNNIDISPQIGYQKDGELGSRNDRKEYDLPERARMPKLERNCTEACMNTYIGTSSDWVNVRTTISTAPDQMAVAPGSLRKEWTGNDAQGRPRKYFTYALDHESLNFYSFISARFEVNRSKWNGIDVEVYYDKKHPYNVKNMSESIKGALAYYTANFGPYRHKQARIVEFPRYASFAQAFPGTMPYSESIGFISKIDPETDIDMVKYVVAHEMGHQWWAHQVVGADMQGATLLSETLAQYSALMVMQQRYGRDRMKRFLGYESDRYLGARGSESEKEVPLEKVENQGYVHYNKGSLVMFNMKEFIGEKAVNNALHALTSAFAYRQPPYPTAYELVDRLRANTPDSLKSTIHDLFEHITIYDNRATAVSARKRKDGQYDVSVTVQTAKLLADSLGRETPLPLNDLIDVGVYGKPADGKKIGKLLAMQRTRMKAKTGTYSFVVKEAPYEAGVDPLSYLADRIPADNLKKITGL